MTPVHPGKILKDELDARGLSINRLAIALRVPSGRLTYIVNGKRNISPDTALRLARYFSAQAPHSGSTYRRTMTLPWLKKYSVAPLRLK